MKSLHLKGWGSWGIIWRRKEVSNVSEGTSFCFSLWMIAAFVPLLSRTVPQGMLHQILYEYFYKYLLRAVLKQTDGN